MQPSYAYRRRPLAERLALSAPSAIATAAASAAALGASVSVLMCVSALQDSTYGFHSLTCGLHASVRKVHFGIFNGSWLVNNGVGLPSRAARRSCRRSSGKVAESDAE
eukprot:2523165-Amphidinium_carterae.1